MKHPQILKALLFTLVVSVAGCSSSQRPPDADSFADPDVPYVPTPPHIVNAMLRLAEVSEEDVVYDLGSGDGRIVIAAAEQYGARGVGVEIDQSLVELARDNAREAGVEGLVEFRQGDLFEADISEATVVTLYLLSSVNLRLRPKLLQELPVGTVVVSQSFDMGAWQPEETVEVDGRPIFRWTIPEDPSDIPGDLGDG